MAETRRAFHRLYARAIGYQPYALIDVVDAARSGLYEGAISLTTSEAVTIMNRFFPEMS
jgi:hypothetical protein